MLTGDVRPPSSKIGVTNAESCPVAFTGSKAKLWLKTCFCWAVARCTSQTRTASAISIAARRHIDPMTPVYGDG